MGALRPVNGTWQDYEVPRLVGVLSYEDEEAMFTQLRGWWRMIDSLREYRRRLAACRDALVEQWPPERSAAARAFVEHVDMQVAALDAAVDAASKNAGALTGIMNTITSAKRDIGTLYEEWQTHAQAETAAGSTSLAGLPANWRENLNDRAQVVMHHTELDIAESAANIRALPIAKYESSVPIPDETGLTAPSDSSGVERLRSPAIPMPLHAGVDASSPGPVLAGAPGDLAGASKPGETQLGRMDVAPASVSDPEAVSGGARRVPGVIGSVWGKALESRVPRLRSGGPALRPVNPNNGLIGVTRQPPASSAPGVGTSARVSGVAPGAVGGIRGALGSRRGSPDGRRTTVKWQADEGVPPVIEPKPEPRHDPGPGVIGIDR